MRHSPLHDIHLQLGGSMVEFAGWNMPIKFAGIIEEHVYTRQLCSFFDVSHMGRLKLRGAGTADLLERLCTRRVGDMAVGQCRYSHMCNNEGGILDDLIVSRYEDAWGIVCNASNREKIVLWIQSHIRGADVELADQTFSTCMVAIQGPRTQEFAAQLVPFDLAGLKNYRFMHGVHSGIGYTIARSGYTGEDGFEIIVGAGVAKMLAQQLINFEHDGTHPIKPAGLGARDTLRLEAGMPLYGHELSEQWDSLTAGQGWCVDLEKDFVGADVMRTVKAEGRARKVIGLELKGRRIARQGYNVMLDGTRIGEITSGTLSPTLGKSIAMALVRADAGDVGDSVTVDLSGRPTDATIVKLPFYQRPR